MNIFSRMTKFIKPYWHYQIIATLFAIIANGSFLFMPYIFKIFIDEVLAKKRADIFTKVLLAYFGVVLAFVVFDFMKHFIFSIMNEKVKRDSRIYLYKHLRNTEMKKFDNYKIGTLMSYLLNDTNQMSGTLASTLTTLLENLLRIIVGVIVLASIDAKILLIVIMFLPLYLLDILVFNKPIKHYTKKLLEQNEIVTHTLQENLSGTHEILVLNRKEWEIKRLIRIFNQYIKIAVKNLLWSKGSSDVGFLIYWFVIVLVYFIGGRKVLDGTMTIGMLLFYAHYIYNIFMPSKLIVDNVINIQKSIASGERYFSLIDNTSPEAVTSGTQKLSVHEFRNEIEFRDVCFKYKEEMVLKNINFEIKKGETVGIVGSSGAGKSTLINLLLNLYKPDSGEILIDSVNINRIKTEDLFNLISVVFQDVFLFDGTISDNIQLGKLEANQEEIEKAAKKANADSFINSLTEKYISNVGERGAKLSGGQKQRISIARALLRDTNVVIFDEATSSLDSENKSIINDTISQLKSENKTVIFVTHDLNSIKALDKIIVLDNGEIKEVGLHEDLSNESEVYKRLSKNI